MIMDNVSFRIYIRKVNIFKNLMEWLKSDFFSRFLFWGVSPNEVVTLQFTAINITVYITMIAIFLIFLNLLLFGIYTLATHYKAKNSSSVFRFEFTNSVTKYFITFLVTGVLVNIFCIKGYCTPELSYAGSLGDS